MTWERLADKIRVHIKNYMDNGQGWFDNTVYFIKGEINKSGLPDDQKQLAIDSTIGCLQTMINSLEKIRPVL